MRAACEAHKSRSTAAQTVSVYSFPALHLSPCSFIHCIVNGHHRRHVIFGWRPPLFLHCIVKHLFRGVRPRGATGGRVSSGACWDGRVLTPGVEGFLLTGEGSVWGRRHLVAWIDAHDRTAPAPASTSKRRCVRVDYRAACLMKSHEKIE